MAKLVIVESPSKIKSVKKYLGSGYNVMAQCMNTGITCNDGTNNICAATNENPDDLPCFVILQKPHSGAGMLLDGVLDEIDI